MEKDLKDLLIKDLCARLPYGVKCQIDTGDADVYVDTLATITIDGCVCFMETMDTEDALEYDNIKPYLFPLSSMTEEQKKVFDQCIELELKAISGEIDHTQSTAFEVDFYNKHHLDWRGLIPMGLAIDATGLNIY
jgi:hypothetical protein